MEFFIKTFFGILMLVFLYITYRFIESRKDDKNTKRQTDMFITFLLGIAAGASCVTVMFTKVMVELLQ
jgi:hypothetical protein